MKGTLLVLVAQAVLIDGVHAQPIDSSDATAEAALNQGNDAFSKGNYVEACKLFKTSYDANANMGALFNLGDCNFKQGRLATAKSHLNKLVVRATALLERGSQDSSVKERLAAAQARLGQIEPRLSYLKFTTSERPVSFAVKIDGVDISTLIDAPFPVDLGSHEIVASASKYEVLTVKVVVSSEATTYPVEIGKLIPSKEAPVAPKPVDSSMVVAKPPAPAAEPARSNRRLISYAVGGAGGLTLVTGLVFAAKAKSQYDDAHSSGHCDANTICDQDGVDQVNKAHTTSNVATVLVGTGIAAIGAGVFLWLTSPAKARETRTSVRLVPHSGGVSAAVAGSF